MPVTTNEFRPGLTTGFSQTTTIDAGTYSVKQMAQGFHLPEYDYLIFDPATAPATGNQTITYKTGGASGVVVATLTLTYSSGDLLSVAKS
jgi:hypothetical protein